MEIKYYDIINLAIPQGSVVGCLLFFLIYINDLQKVINEGCILLVDDISLLTKCENSSNLSEKIRTKNSADKSPL